MASNLVKRFNSWLRHEHHHNICVLFIKHMYKVDTLLADHQSQIHRWNGCFWPKTQEKIASNITRGETYITHAFFAWLIKITTRFSYHELDLKNGTCSCRLW